MATPIPTSARKTITKYMIERRLQNKDKLPQVLALLYSPASL